jgi:hypothetical protein
MLEIIVARVLSVALASHFAFVAISVAMFGIGLSALVVYLLPDYFRADRLDHQLTAYTCGFSVSTALSMFLFLHIQVAQELSFQGFWTLSLAYSLLAVPFFFAGICISLLMTHFSSRIGRIYCADLIGASLGCIGVVAAMQTIPAPVVAVLIAVVVAATALCFALMASPRRLGAPLASLLVVGAILIGGGATGHLRMKFIKNWDHHYGEYEVWNAFSRVSVFPSKLRAAQHVQIKEAMQAPDADRSPETKLIDIDGGAWTPMMNFRGDAAALGFLRESVMYSAHHVKPNASVLIIGTGGGRDILAARAFGQPSILGIELNPSLRHVVQERFGDYSGRPYTLPGVEVIIDEARSRLSTLDRVFDIIQISLIDTFALNAAGGFVYSENYLYTREAFEEYFQHLTPDGILTVTRYFVDRYPLEILKLAGLTRAAWSASGIADPSKHIVVLGQGIHFSVLAKRSPFTGEEVASLAAVARQNGMVVLFNPGSSGDDMGLATMLTTPDFRGFVDAHPYQIAPPTDDRPFFFNLLRGRLAAGDVPDRANDPFLFMRLWNDAVLLMYLLIAVVSTLAAVFFFGPLLFARRSQVNRIGGAATVPLLLYFACLGYGFMMIEVPLLQRFVLFLGYPVYSLTVVLFALLLSSGIGSLLSARFTAEPRAALARVLATIIVVSGAYVYIVPATVQALLGMPIAVRMAVTVALLIPLGLVLGMAYPLGIALLREGREQLVPWAWALNGALSVVASVWAIFLGSRVGFTAALLTGIAAYGVALVAVLVAPRARASIPERAEVTGGETALSRRAAALP